jgi:hypothetical protein
VPVPVRTPDMQLPGDLRANGYSPQRFDLLPAGNLDVRDLVPGIPEPPDPDEADATLVIDYEVEREDDPRYARREDQASAGRLLALGLANRHGGRVSPGHRASPRFSTAAHEEFTGDMKLRPFLVRRVWEIFTVLYCCLKQVVEECPSISFIRSCRCIVISLYMFFSCHRPVRQAEIESVRSHSYGSRSSARRPPLPAARSRVAQTCYLFVVKCMPE